MPLYIYSVYVFTVFRVPFIFTVIFYFRVCGVPCLAGSLFVWCRQVQLYNVIYRLLVLLFGRWRSFAAVPCG